MQEILEAYNSGATFPELRKKFHKNPRDISKILNSYGIDVVKNQHIRAANTRRNRPIKALISQKEINKDILPEEWAYIAGFFDAEGCIEGANKNKDSGLFNGYRVSISQKDPEILKWIQEKIGYGTVNIKENRSGNYFILCSQKTVFQFLNRVSPYLIVKRDKANIALDLYEKRYGWLKDKYECVSKEESWAYIAGMMDGDGCITCSNSCWRIIISQKGVDLHKWLKGFLAYGTIKMRKQPKKLSHLEPVNSYIISPFLHQEHFVNSILPFSKRINAKALQLLDYVSEKRKKGLHGGVLKLPKQIS